MKRDGIELSIFSTAPQSADVPEGEYLARLARVSRWSEEAGCRGMLVYTDNRLVDPWLVAQAAIEATERLSPLVATQPAYMHPYAVAKMIASIGYLYGRQVHLNMVAGGFKKDLEALGDATPHDARYERLTEYTKIILGLLSGQGSFTLEGRFYQVEGLSMKPPLAPELAPPIFLSGSSPAGRAAALALGATAIEYPESGENYEEKGPATGPGAGIRIGIVAEESEERAWALARARFPEDRRGQLAHGLAMKVSDSAWHKQLSRLAEETVPGESPYWLWPFKNYSTFCPYLVGSYDTVAGELSRYIRAGFRVFILDIPADEHDLAAAGEVFRRALSLAS